MVGAGAAEGSKLPAAPITGKNITTTTARTITALTTYGFFLHMAIISYSR
jgi:hypothetical protein